MSILWRCQQYTVPSSESKPTYNVVALMVTVSLVERRLNSNVGMEMVTSLTVQYNVDERS